MIAGACPEGWLSNEGKCYGHPTANKLNWTDAEAFCQSWSSGAHLASIHSAEEDQFVQDNFPGNIWLGGSDTTQEGSWVWSDGTPWDFSNWSSGQPDDNTSGQDCLHGNKWTHWWDDSYCEREDLFLCKK